jgi:hypothetical protein
MMDAESGGGVDGPFQHPHPAVHHWRRPQVGRLPCLPGIVYMVMIDKQVILNALRDRGQDLRADWVDKELPDEVETDVHTGIFSILRLDPADLGQSPS